MLNIYKATVLDRIAIKGGSTKPCIITVEDDLDKVVGAYVVKIFRQNHILQALPTNKEIICNVLAREFDLSVPEIALVHVDSFIISELKHSGHFDSVHILPGTYFGSEFIEKTIDYSINTPTYLFDTWEIETIFAFDVLIRNIDRRVAKPNLFIKDENFYLIDHELCFGAPERTFKKCLENNSWVFITRKASRHLFLDQLRSNKEQLTFETFFYYLKNLNVEKLNTYEGILRNLGHDTIDFLLIKEYLYEVKANQKAFKALLLQLIYNE